MFAAVVLVFGAGAAGATTTSVYCPPTGSDSLQAKINSAGSGDTLVIHGTCMGNFSIGKNLTLQGAGSAPTLNGNASGHTLEIAGGYTVSITKLTITNGSASEGGGIYSLSGSTVNLINSSVTGNSASFEGGGVFEVNSATLHLTGSSVSNNTGYRGGGLYLSAGNTTSLSNSSVNGNVASAKSGGGIYLDGGSLTLTGSAVSGNRAEQFHYGGGISVTSGSVSVTNSTVSNNTAGGGGGITGNELHLTIIGSAITGNRAVSYEGGGIAIYGMYSGAGTVISDSTISGNSAFYAFGGGIVNDAYYGDSPLSIQNSQITDNSDVNGNGGGVGNVGDFGNTASLTITGSILAGNRANSGLGGAIYNANGFYSNSGQATASIGQTTVGPRPNFLNDSNQARYGGGIANDGTNGLASVSLQPSTNVLHNQVTVDGGGLFNTGGGLFTIAPGANIFANTPDNIS